MVGVVVGVAVMFGRQKMIPVPQFFLLVGIFVIGEMVLCDGHAVSLELSSDAVVRERSSRDFLHCSVLSIHAQKAPSGAPRSLVFFPKLSAMLAFVS